MAGDLPSWHFESQERRSMSGAVTEPTETPHASRGPVVRAEQAHGKKN